MNYQSIAVTSGEPAGIGPDILVQVAQRQQQAALIVIADPELLRKRAEQLKLPLTLRLYQRDYPNPPLPAGAVYNLPVHLAAACRAGELNRINAHYVLKTLEIAATGCLQGQFDAMVTAPVQKSIINDAGIPFSGHTEYLADLTKTPKVVMMLATKGLRVALATTHLPLADVPAAITEDSLKQVISILNRDLKEKFALSNPHILVCGLNPHAGEGGHLGREEIEVIAPTLNKLREQGIELQGPLPADTLFTPKYLEQADAVLAMYHDQGLPVLKHQGFGQAVNITLGLPIIRTSVDHGTALDLAGTGKADAGSLQVAIDYATTMAAAAGSKNSAG